MKDTYEVSITAEDVFKSYPGDTCNCIVAMAVKRVFQEEHEDADYYNVSAQYPNNFPVISAKKQTDEKYIQYVCVERDNEIYEDTLLARHMEGFDTAYERSHEEAETVEEQAIIAREWAFQNEIPGYVFKLKRVKEARQ